MRSASPMASSARQAPPYDRSAPLKKVSKLDATKEAKADARYRKLSGKVARLQRRLASARADEAAEDERAVRSKRLPGITELVAAAYDMCVVEQDALGRSDRFCSLFIGPHLETMAKYELLSDAADYWKQGAGDPIAYAASCVLLDDLIAKGDAGLAAARDGETGAFANFRFGHSETIMPVLSLLGLWQEADSPNPEDHYTEELSRGTMHLLDATRARLKALSGFDGGGIAVKSVASSTHRKCTWPLAATGPSAVQNSSAARPLPHGFSEDLLLALKHPWAGARLVPMAANVQWELYDCGEGDDADDAEVGLVAGAGAVKENKESSAMRGAWVKMLHNEREVPFPACHGSDTERMSKNSSDVEWHEPTANAAAARFGMRFPCPWDIVKDYYHKEVYERLGVGSCDAAAFEQMCGGVSHVCETDEGLKAKQSADALLF